ncbi:hypothetical protein [Brachybacterium paraconglomeratum]|uniref:hypothetical protein n=1 Tax=Brachybacterium paraconglomeratum TaxID=173362 RepID=UPI0022DEEF6A|nr:hypothetical protein [Brachybacterium paraconglomeratum]
MSTDEYVPSDSEEWALVDLLGTIIEDVNDEPQFTVSEHALMAAGTIRREWLTAHDARVRRDAEAELDSWMARAYEAEKRAWQAEARIKAVRDVLDEQEAHFRAFWAANGKPDAATPGISVADIRRALEG